MTADERQIVRRAVEQLQGIAADLERGPQGGEDAAAYEARVAARLRTLADLLAPIGNAGDA